MKNTDFYLNLYIRMPLHNIFLKHFSESSTYRIFLYFFKQYTNLKIPNNKKFDKEILREKRKKC